MDKLWLLSTSLFLLAWFLSACIPPRRPPIVNYGNFELMCASQAINSPVK